MLLLLPLLAMLLVCVAGLDVAGVVDPTASGGGGGASVATAAAAAVAPSPPMCDGAGAFGRNSDGKAKQSKPGVPIGRERSQGDGQA